MNKDVIFRGFVTSLLVTGSVGAVIFLFLPSWTALVRDVGLKGAWGVLIIFHLIYSLLIGISTFVFLKILEKLKYQGSVFGAGLSAAVTVTIVNIVSSGESINFGGFFVFALWLVWLTWVMNFVIFLSIKLLHHRFDPTAKSGTG
jgi:hypothetical protein